MNREILFRGINFQKEWVYGDLFHSYANDDIAIAYYREGSKTPTFDAIFPESVGQYTGLKDENGKKIFEGDIVTIGNNLKAVVIWFNGSFRFKDELSCKATYLDDIGTVIRDYDVCIIGNIHDNSELMKGVSNEA